MHFRNFREDPNSIRIQTLGKPESLSFNFLKNIQQSNKVMVKYKFFRLVVFSLQIRQVGKIGFYYLNPTHYRA